MNTMNLQVAGQTLILDHARAVFWPAQSTLLLADVHLGKGAVLRRSGIAVPSGDTLDDLQRIDELIARHAPARLIVLGDLVHGPAAAASDWVSRVQRWRQHHAAIAMDLIDGNHDRHYDARPLGFNLLGATLACGPFVLCHEPLTAVDGYVLAGHVHPGIAARDGWRKHRLPAFRFGPRLGLLPAFGRLTGLQVTPAKPDETIVAVTPSGLLAVHDERPQAGLE